MYIYNVAVIGGLTAKKINLSEVLRRQKDTKDKQKKIFSPRDI